MVKIFIGNLPKESWESKDEIEALFAEYGKVTECAIMKDKNFGFVHMEDRKAATKAIRALHQHKLNGTAINVEASHGKMNRGSVKLHVGNVDKGSNDKLRALFEEYGTVTECSIVKNFAFVHMDYDEGMDAMKDLDNTEFDGKRIHVQVSKSRPKYEESEEYPPPHERGYWPPRYPDDRHHLPPRGYPPPPRRVPYPERAYESDGYGMVDYYEKYRARPYSISSTTTIIYDDRHAGAIPLPPPPSARTMSASLDPYERRPLPPLPSASYYARDRSPIRRVPAPSTAPAASAYSYEQSRLPPASGASVYARDPYADRLPPAPSARYAY